MDLGNVEQAEPIVDGHRVTKSHTQFDYLSWRYLKNKDINQNACTKKKAIDAWNILLLIMFINCDPIKCTKLCAGVL